MKGWWIRGALWKHGVPLYPCREASMKTKHEYLIQELYDSYGFSVLVCENDMIVARRTFHSLSILMEDAARWAVHHKNGRVALETRGGRVVELNGFST